MLRILFTEIFGLNSIRVGFDGYLNVRALFQSHRVSFFIL